MALGRRRDLDKKKIKKIKDEEDKKEEKKQEEKKQEEKKDDEKQEENEKFTNEMKNLFNDVKDVNKYNPDDDNDDFEGNESIPEGIRTRIPSEKQKKYKNLI